MVHIRGLLAVALLGFVGLVGLVGGYPTAGGASDLGAPATTTSVPAAQAPVCAPVGDGSGTQVFVGLREWRVDVDPASAPAGKTTFRVNNEGGEVHELVVVKGDKPDALPVKGGAVDEEALPKGDFIGEVEGFKAGGVCPGTFDLQAGQYVLFCNIVEKERDGKLESHYEKGMRVAFSVTAPAAAPPAPAETPAPAPPPAEASAPAAAPAATPSPAAPSQAAAPAPPAAGANAAPEPAPTVAGANALRTSQPAATTPGTMPRTGVGSRGLLTLAGLALAVGGLGVATGPARRRSARRPIQPARRLW